MDPLQLLTPSSAAGEGKQTVTAVPVFPPLPQLRWVRFLSRAAGEDARHAEINCLSMILWRPTRNGVQAVA